MAFQSAQVGRASLGHPYTASLIDKPRHLQLHLRASAHPERSGSSNGEAPVASPFLPTRVRVQHDTYIRASRAAIWSLMQEVTPAQQWQQIAVVLATLESIYGVEYQGLAEQLLTAFQQANRNPISGQAGPTPSRVASPTARPANPPAYPASSGSFDSEQFQYDHLGPSGLPLTAGAVDNRSETRRQNGSSKGNGTSSARSLAVEQQQQQLLLQNSGSGSSNSTNRAAAASQATATASDEEELSLPQDAEAAAAAAADAAFMQLLLLLAQRAGFVPLSQRDVALGVSLNTDFLWQLFVKVSDEQLDGQLVSRDILAGTGIGSTEVQLPKETQQLLVLRRGYSSEQQRGRWLIQKLDYLQLLLVRRAAGGISRLGAHIGKQAQDLRTQSQQQQRSKRRVRQQRAVPSKHHAAKQEQSMSKTGSSGSSMKVGSRVRGDAAQRSRRATAPHTDSFGRPYPDTVASEEGADASSVNDRSCGTRFGLQFGSRHSSSTKNSSSSGQSDTLQAAPDTSSSSNNESESGLSANSQTGAESQPLEQDGIAQQQRRQQHGLMARVSARLEQSVDNVLHTLSDWGVIPRMDVTPLERFDEVYPLSEPSRFQPLYIQKATLPDILNPVIEPRLAWLGSRDRDEQHEHVACSSESSSSSSADNASNGNMDVTRGTSDNASSHSERNSSNGSNNSSSNSSSDSSGSTLLQTLLQPVEIVEPTFRQLLVVYRKKPRQEKWRELWSKLTGQQVPAAATRRAGIQLQVREQDSSSLREVDM